MLKTLSLFGVLALSVIGSSFNTLPKEEALPKYSSSLPKVIELRDNSENEIRSYYSNLNSLSSSERQGQNLLKNLRPIIHDLTYFSYDSVWKIYEITDREWSLSPASEDQYGEYNSSSNKYENYQYSSSNSNTKNNPYVHTLYRNRDANGATVEEGRIKEWGDHTQTGGTNREHVWCQSRGFKAPSGAEGPAGTDLHHLMSGDGYVNGKPHNNNPYGYVDKSKITINAGSEYSYCAGNYAGTPLHASSNDESDVVFEPQDSDKGDIARACFYMVACYNNISGSKTITQFDPNLTLVNYATSNGEHEDSSATHPVAMGILKDLLEWNKLDPVDDYEVHRNNLIFNNYQHNRNPFVDFPEWADVIWGTSDNVGTPVGTANPSTDAISPSSHIDPPNPPTPPVDDKPAIDPKILIIGGAIALAIILVIVIIAVTTKNKKAKKALKKVAKTAKKMRKRK